MDLRALAYATATCKSVTLPSGEQVLQPSKAYRNDLWLTSHGAKPVRVLCERQPACADVVRNALCLGVVVAALAAEPAVPGPAWSGECGGAFLHRLCERLFQSCAHEHHVAKLRAGAHACSSARPTLSHA